MAYSVIEIDRIEKWREKIFAYRFGELQKIPVVGPHLAGIAYGAYVAAKIERLSEKNKRSALCR